MTQINTWTLGLFAWLAVSVPAFAQEAVQGTKSEELPGVLNIVTLVLVLAIAVGAFMWFLRKRSNREATERGLGLDETNQRGYDNTRR